MQHLTQEQKKQLRSELQTELSEVTRRLKQNENLQMNQPMRESIGELSLIDNHPADVGSEWFERGKDLALTERLEHHKTEIEEAIQRLDNGTYGTCRECGEPIPFARLQAVPSTDFCIQHAPKYEKTHNRPLEEQFLQPAMRSSVDGKDTTAFDGEDAWQIVEQWGTSNTPALQEGRNLDDYNEMYLEADEHDGYVEAVESFLATDIYGNGATFYRNSEYRSYMRHGEGDPLLEMDPPFGEEDSDGYTYS